MATKTATAEKKVKGLYFEARAEIALPPSESQFYGAMKVIAAQGFRVVAGPLGILARSPAPSLELAQEALVSLGANLRVDGFKVNSYSIGEVFVDSGSFDTLKLLETPPHADKPSHA